MVTASAGTHSTAREESRWVAAVAPVGGPFSRFGTGWERGGGAGRGDGGEGAGEAQPACASNQFIYLNNKHPAFRGARPRAVPEWDETVCLYRSPPTSPGGFNCPPPFEEMTGCVQGVPGCPGMWVTPEPPAAMAGRQTPFSRTLLSLPGFKSPFLLPAVFIHLNGDKEKPTKHFLKEKKCFLPQKVKQCCINRMSLKRQTNKRLCLKEPDGLIKSLLAAVWWGTLGLGCFWGLMGQYFRSGF